MHFHVLQVSLIPCSFLPKYSLLTNSFRLKISLYIEIKVIKMSHPLYSSGSARMPPNMRITRGLQEGYKRDLSRLGCLQIECLGCSARMPPNSGIYPA